MHINEPLWLSHMHYLGLARTRGRLGQEAMHCLLEPGAH